MRERAILFAMVVAAMLALAACTSTHPTGGVPPAQKDAPERGGDHGGGGMM